MITFLPSTSFSECAEILDWRRLNRQRTEAKWVLEHLLGFKKFFNHPLLRMWQGFEDALCHYGMHICIEWQERGYTDNQYNFFSNYCETPYIDCKKPFWLGNEQLHSSHRSRLITKFPAYYSKFNWKEVPNEHINYYWPL